MRILTLIGALAVISAVGGAVFFFGGLYNVAGTAEDPGIVTWALVRTRVASIAHHANDPVPPSYNDAASVQAGARAFAERGCTLCHGGPGVNWAKFSEGLHPSPPDLKEVVSALTPGQLFWVVKNGINMTGMPSFALAGVKDAEIWQITGFLTKLPSASDAEYKAWVAAPEAAPPVIASPSPAPKP